MLHENDLQNLESILSTYDDTRQNDMLQDVINHKDYFTLDYMCKYVIDTLQQETIHVLHEGKQSMTFL